MFSISVHEAVESVGDITCVYSTIRNIHIRYSQVFICAYEHTIVFFVPLVIWLRVTIAPTSILVFSPTT